MTNTVNPVLYNLNKTYGGLDMTNELQAFESLSKEEIMKMTGQDDDSQMGSGILPRLSINKLAEDDDGNALRPGVYTIYDPESEKKVYSLKDKPVNFRPFINAYQYMQYDAENNNYSCTSVIFKSWKDDPIDSKGGVRCGKVIGKDKNQLSKAELDNQRDTKCYRLVYGLLSMDCTTADGQPTSIEDVPILWRVTGTNFKPVGESLKSLKSRGNLMQNHFLNLTSNRRKSGDTVWYVSKIVIDNKTVKFTKKDLETMDLFTDLITDENKRVSDAYHKANDKKETDKITEKVINDLEDDPATILAS